MPNKDNDSLINDILNELENNKKQSVQEENSADVSVTPLQEIDNSTQNEPTDISSSPENSPINNETPEISTYQDDVKIRKAPQKNTRPAANSQYKNNAPANRSGKKKKKKKKQRSRLPGVLILTTFIFAVSICLSMVIIAYGKDMLGIGKSETTTKIEIPEGATTEDISLILEEKGIIKSPEFFQLFSRLSKADSKYIAGDHYIRANMAYETIIQELTSTDSEKKESVEVTFPEGITIYDAALLLEENGVCSVDDFLFYFNAGNLGFSFEEKIPPSSSLKFYRMEGFLFPDTYIFTVDMDPDLVCQKIYDNFDEKMAGKMNLNNVEYSRYQRMEELGLDLNELITFASIVQKEAATMEMMTTVSSVFWNRINNPEIFPLLQSDPTRLYAENVIKPNMQVYDQVVIDAYNTYTSAGLPPGPICNPGLDAIDAVLTAFETEYFYFIANVNTGETFFSKTLEEHEAYQAMIEESYASQGG